MPPAVSLRRLGVERGGRWVVRGLTAEIPAGSFVALWGPSGSGKTSLLACAAGLLAAGEGEVSFRGRPPASAGARVGMVFQELRLVAGATVLHNVLCGRLGRYPWWSTLFSFPRADRADAFALLSELGLADRALRRASEVSGGEQQRTAIARALHQEPEVLLADEPVSNLDPALAERVLGLLRRRADAGLTIVCALHQPELVRRFADGVIDLSGPPGSAALVPIGDWSGAP